MGEISESLFVAIANVSKGQNVQLLLITTTSGVDREQNWPCYGCSNQAQDNRHLEQTQKEESIQVGLLQNENIRKSPELFEPTKESWRKGSGMFPIPLLV